MRAAGHNIYVVTMRDEKNEGHEVKEELASKVNAIYFTARKAKASFMFDKGISIDVWIDDMPTFIAVNAFGG
jgi:hypothetical protein